MSKQFIFIEDRNTETGHGWRYHPHEFAHDWRGEDGDLDVFILCEQDDETWKEKGRHPSCSYAWICSKEYYDKHKHLEDNIRTHHVADFHPTFKGVDDMESHFEFEMNPIEMRKHLLSLGFVEYPQW